MLHTQQIHNRKHLVVLHIDLQCPQTFGSNSLILIKACVHLQYPLFYKYGEALEDPVEEAMPDQILIQKREFDTQFHVKLRDYISLLSLMNPQRT